MEASTTQRNTTLDVLKCLACFLIVTIHAPFPSYLGALFLTVARIAVPFFFMVSGYFFYRKNDVGISALAKKRIKHTLWLILWGMLAFALLFFAWNGFELSALLTLVQWRSVKAWLFFLFLNDVGFLFATMDVLWFLFALLYVYVIFWLLGKFHLWKVAYCLILPLFIALFVVSNILVRLDFTIVICYYRNFFLTGLPFMLLGHWMHAKEEKLVRISAKYLVLGVVVGLAEAIVVQLFLTESFYADSKEHYIGTFFAVACLFALALKYPSVHIPVVGFIGRELSLYVYLLHVLVLSSLNKLYTSEALWFRLIHPILIIALSVLVSLLVWLVVSFFHKRRARRIQ